MVLICAILSDDRNLEHLPKKLAAIFLNDLGRNSEFREKMLKNAFVSDFAEASLRRSSFLIKSSTL